MARKNTPVDPFAHVRKDVLDAVGGICKSCGNFADKDLKIAPLAREIGIAPVTLSAYLKGGTDVGRKNLVRLLNFLSARNGAETQEQADAIAEAQSL